VIVDSHCHLDDPRFDEDRDETVARAQAAGVARLLAVGTGKGPPDLDAAIRLSDRYECMLATVGVHPHDAAKWTTGCIQAIRERCGHPKVVILGEIGLDFHYNFSPPETQRNVFRAQMKIAADTGKPIAIHTREAWADTLAILREFPGVRGVFHCFTGGPREASEALDLGYYLSFGGVVTFPKASGLQEAARLTPSDRMLVETDAPYLAPVPYRGKRNEPAFVTEVVKKLAELRETTAQEIAQTTTQNFERLCLRYTG
jgi:TatD DNase family protein